MTSRPIDKAAVNNFDYFLSRGDEHEAECIEAMSLLFSIPDNESCGACTCSCIFTSRLPLANIVSKPISWRQTNTGPFKESGIAFIPPINLINERWPRYKNRFAHSKNRKSSPRFEQFPSIATCREEMRFDLFAVRIGNLARYYEIETRERGLLIDLDCLTT